MNSPSLVVTGESELAQFIRARGPHCLIVARHGETDWNAEGRLQGQQDPPLNSRGRSQALATANFLRGLPLQQVHSSTLRRCQRTADSIVETNLSGPEVISSDLLKETTLGVLEGELKDQLSTTVWGLDRYRIRALEQILSEEILSLADRILTKETLVKKLRILIAGAHKRGNQEVVAEYEPRLSEWEQVGV